MPHTGVWYPRRPWLHCDHSILLRPKRGPSTGRDGQLLNIWGHEKPLLVLPLRLLLWLGWRLQAL